jgi:hypothetical protein
MRLYVVSSRTDSLPKQFICGAGMMLGANGDRGLGLIIGGRVLAGLGVGAASNMV